jgi:predicted nucleic acid-binding protein
MAWCFEDEVSLYADQVLDQLKLDDREAIVPVLWPLEVTNVLLVNERRGRLSAAQSRRFLELLTAMPVTVDEKSLHTHSLQLLALGREHGLSSYDASYLELAERRGLPLATADKKLLKAIGDRGIEVFLATP